MKPLRSTFRNPVDSGVAWQKELRDRYLSEGAPPVPHLDLKRAVVRRVSSRFAESIILKYEWLGTMASTTYHYGLFFGDYAAGVVCYGISTGPHSHEPYAIAKNELICLARGACVHWAPKNANSRLISLSTRLLARVSPARLVLAYSDTDAGEIGTVYQAAGWTYIGKTEPNDQWLSPTGRVYHSQLVYGIAQNAGIKKRTPWREIANQLLDAGWKHERANQKLKYALVLRRDDRALVELIESLKKPYPKRAGSIDSDALRDQRRESDASSTPALQLS